MNEPGKKRVLGLWMLTALVAGNMIGSGIFLLPASLAAYGSISILAWIFTAFGALLLALVFAALSEANPKIGGPYAYTHEAFGDFIGFQVAYNYWIALWVGNGGIAVACVSYLSVFFPDLATNHLLSFSLAVGLVWFLTIVNLIGVKTAGSLQLLTTILKLVPLVLIAVVGIFYIHPAELHANFNLTGHSNFSAFTGAAALTLWSFIGVESATIPAENVIKPRWTIPRATLLGVVITALVYIFSTIAVMGVMPLTTLMHSSAPYADAGKIIFGAWGGKFIAVGAVISCFGALNGWTMLQGQIPLAAARDKLFPSHFAKMSKNNTPYVGLIVSAVCITVLLMLNLRASLVEQFTFIIMLATFATIIPYLLTTMAQILLFMKNRDSFNAKHFTRSAIIATLAFCYSYWAMIGSGQEIVYYGTLLFFTGIPIYVWMKWHIKADA